MGACITGWVIGSLCAEAVSLFNLQGSKIHEELDLEHLKMKELHSFEV
jgi:hypothetical protein